MVGDPRANGLKINDLERRVSKSDAVPPGSPARFRSGAGVRGRGAAKGVCAAGAFRPCRAPASAAVVGIPRANGRKINDLERRVSNSDAVLPGSTARFRSGAGVRGRGVGEGRLPRRCVPSAPGPGERRRSGYSASKPSQNQRPGTPSVEFGRCSALCADPVPPRCGYPGTRSGDGALIPPVRLVRVAPRRALARWVFRERTVAKSTVWSAECRTRTVFRFARRPGPRRALESVAVVGIPRSNGRGINDLGREMSNSHSGRPGRGRSRDDPGTPRGLSRAYQMSPRVKPSGKGSEGSSE